MKIECEVQTSKTTNFGHPKAVKVTLEGEFEAIVDLLAKLGLNPVAPDAPKIE